MQFCGLTDPGKTRENNQDVFLFRETCGCLIAVLCDGVGGHVGGREADQTAINTFTDKLEEKLSDLYDRSENAFFDRIPTYIEKFFTLAADQANLAVLSRAKQTGDVGMCTTLVCALIANQQLHVFSVGDSRLYELSPLPQQITKDQSWVQSMVDAGKITPEEAKNHPKKNLILSVIGTDRGVEGDYLSKRIPDTGAGYMLCSDGLSDYMDIFSFDDLFSVEHTPKELCSLLIDRANDYGGKDNITVQIIHTA